MKLRSISAVTAALSAIVLAGCSDNSNMRFVIDSITDASSTSKNYLEADVVGSASNACTTIQEQVKVTVRLEKPGSVGPSLDARVTAVTAEYFYYHPVNGQLLGPVTLLGSKNSNYSAYLTADQTTSFLVPVATYLVKTWSYGYSDCFGVPRSADLGVMVVDRMVVRITVDAEDDTGKKLTAQGSILLYLQDYGPYPNGTDCDVVGTRIGVASLCTNPISSTLF